MKLIPRTSPPPPRHNCPQVNYFPSRYDPARHSDRYPITRQVYTAARERAVIGKENNFKQASLFSLLLSVIALYVSQAGERTVASKRRAVQAGESRFLTPWPVCCKRASAR